MKAYFVQIYVILGDGETDEKGYITECGVPVPFASPTGASKVGRMVTETLNKRLIPDYDFRLVEEELFYGS